MNFDLLTKEIKEHEGFRSIPYCDACSKNFRECTCTPKLSGKLTVGYGWNLEGHPITEELATVVLNHQIIEAYDDVSEYLKEVWDDLSDNRQRVLVNMRFNLGAKSFRTFVRTLRAVMVGRYEDAANSMLVSKWAKQVGQRAVYLAELMRSG